MDMDEGENMILSLDLSTHSSGWAILNENGVLWEYGCEKSSSQDLIKRIHIMINKIDELLKTYDINTIVVEEVRPQGSGVGNQKTMKALMYLQAALEFLIHDNYSKIKIEYVYPSSWRATLGIKNGRGIIRTTLKEADIQYVKDNFKIDKEINDDEADAICIGLAYFKEQDNNEINWG